MATVLFLNAEGPTWWEKQGGEWQPFTGEPVGPVWVVTDLTEETVAEIAVPRIFGNDRKRFVERQLANRFPESPFRTTLDGLPSGSLMSRLAPPKQILMAIEPAERLQAVLATVKAPLAGVWSGSVLLAQMGQDKSLPGNLMIVFGQAASTRIVFLKDHAPVLTRLVPGASTAAEQAVEVVRTLRHLENTHIVQRGVGRLSALLLDTQEGLAAVLSRDRIDAVAHPAPHRIDAEGGWRNALFDQACKSPPGQLAPLPLRAAYLTQLVHRGARYAMVACLVAAVVIASGSVVSNVGDRGLQAGLKSTAGQLAEQTAQLEASIASFGVSPELLRKVLTLDAEEIVNAPDMQQQLVAVSRAVSSVPGARVVSLQWQVLGAQAPSCTQESAAATPEAAASDPAPQSTHKVELKMAFALADGAGPRLQFQQVTQMTSQLKSIAGITVAQDPARSLSEGDLASASAGQGEAQRAFTWCLVLPGTSAPGANP
jgi:hypothetical protein